MSKSALTRSRRSRSSEPTLRLLAFQLRHHWFGVPLAMARRVLPMQTTADGRDVDLIQLQNDNIPVLDAARLVYSDAVPQLPAIAPAPPLADETVAPIHSIVVIELLQGGSVGLIVDGTPALKRVRQSAFSPVPPIYQTMHQMRGLSSLIRPDPSVPDPSSQPIFLLNVEGLLQQGDRLIQAG